MRIGSLCSGIAGCAVAAEGLDFRHVWFAETDKHCCELLAAKYPEVPNLGDAAAIGEPQPVDIVVASPPCQSFSLTGHRRGLGDSRGNLSLLVPGIAAAAGV